MAERFVYLDHNATTPLCPEAREAMLAACAEDCGNASSIHTPGRRARVFVESARKTLAETLGADPEELVFTSGGTEANNTVLKRLLDPGLTWSRRKLVVSAIEHPCVLETARFLESCGIPLAIAPVDGEGRIDPARFAALIDDTTALVSVMAANNETGVIQPVAELTRIAHERGALVHCDAVQAVGKIPVSVADWGVDYLSVSAHKFYGPKGVGALYVRRGAPFLPLLHGGHQEDGKRAGTLNAPGIAGMGAAAALIPESLAREGKRLATLRNRLEKKLLELVPNSRVNGRKAERVPGTLNISFHGAEGEAILLYLDFEGIAVSTGSACASGSLEPSHVLLASGLDAGFAHGSIRFSLGRATSDADIDFVLATVPGIIAKIRGMSTVA